MISIYMVKTPSCSKCMMMKPRWDEIKSNVTSKYEEVEFKEIVLGKDELAQHFVSLLGIKSAPTFVFHRDGMTHIAEPEDYIVDLEEIENIIDRELGE